LVFGVINNLDCPSEHSEESPNLELKNILSNPLFKTFQSYGLIDEIALRNLIIKMQYKQLRKTHTQINSIFELSESFHLSYDAIHHILFRNRPQKKAFYPSPN
jgi:hypothetical protein